VVGGPLDPGSSGSAFSQVASGFRCQGVMCDVHGRAGRSASRMTCGPWVVPGVLAATLLALYVHSPYSEVIDSCDPPL
jgi:hypothetical protein